MLRLRYVKIETELGSCSVVVLYIGVVLCTAHSNLEVLELFCKWKCCLVKAAL